MEDNLLHLIVKNMFVIFFADKSKVDEIELQMLKKLIVEMAVKNEKKDEIIKKAFDSYKKNCKLEFSNDIESNYLILSSITCSSKPTEAHIISHPALEEKNGVTVNYS